MFKALADKTGTSCNQPMLIGKANGLPPVLVQTTCFVSGIGIRLGARVWVTGSDVVDYIGKGMFVVIDGQIVEPPAVVEPETVQEPVQAPVEPLQVVDPGNGSTETAEGVTAPAESVEDRLVREAAEWAAQNDPAAAAAAAAKVETPVAAPVEAKPAKAAAKAKKAAPKKAAAVKKAAAPK